VVDANILVRAVLGRCVRDVIETYAGEVSFFVPESAYAEAEEHLAALVIKRGGDPERRSHSCAPWAAWWNWEARYKASSKGKLESGWAGRDPEEWPILTSALALGSPIWTEDKDFFGCGVATWTSDRVRMFLRE
jgi:predicted nucleic acid-binding protein